MPNLRPDKSLGDGVYFDTNDYVGLGRRLPIFAIDFCLLVAMVFTLGFFWEIALAAHWRWYFVLCLLLSWSYLVPLKRSRLRTLGYRVMRCQIIDWKGQQPSLFMMTFRLLFWVMGPSNFLCDLIWCGIDEDRQTLRDRFSGTCVVRANSRPIGEGAVHFAYYDAMGYNLLIAHVVRPNPMK